MEIEKKFRLEQAHLLEALNGYEHLSGYRLHHADKDEQQQNTYYDTADRRLEQQHYGLRIRQVGTHSVATLKGPAEGSGGMFRRGEWEIETSDPHPASWPPGAAREQAQAVLGDAPLLPLLTIYTRRRIIIAAPPDAPAEQGVAEISLDDVRIEAGGRTRTFAELEIEVLPAGSEADLHSLEAALREHLPLVPEERSKLQQGFEVLREAEQAKE
jgi:inorganic triphosphatase YgiF